MTPLLRRVSSDTRWRIRMAVWSLLSSAAVVGLIILIGWLAQGYVIGHGCHR